MQQETKASNRRRRRCKKLVAGRLQRLSSSPAAHKWAREEKCTTLISSYHFTSVFIQSQMNQLVWAELSFKPILRAQH